MLHSFTSIGHKSRVQIQQHLGFALRVLSMTLHWSTFLLSFTQFHTAHLLPAIPEEKRKVEELCSRTKDMFVFSQMVMVQCFLFLQWHNIGCANNWEEQSMAKYKRERQSWGVKGDSGWCWGYTVYIYLPAGVLWLNLYTVSFMPPLFAEKSRKEEVHSSINLMQPCVCWTPLH